MVVPISCDFRLRPRGSVSGLSSSDPEAVGGITFRLWPWNALVLSLKTRMEELDERWASLLIWPGLEMREWIRAGL